MYFKMGGVPRQVCSCTFLIYHEELRGICIKSYVPDRIVPESMGFCILSVNTNFCTPYEYSCFVWIWNIHNPCRNLWTYKSRANKSDNGAWAQERWSCACSVSPQWWEGKSQPLRIQTGQSPSYQLVDSLPQCVCLPENTFLVMPTHGK